MAHSLITCLSTDTGSPFASFGYAYYADGALAEAADTVGSTSRSYEWDYNPDGSLQYETIGSATTAFEYDAGGNLTAWGASTGWQYAHNRLTEVPSKGYEFYYAANGERSAWFQTPTMPDGSGYRLRADANGDDCVDDADLGIVLEFYGCEAPWTGACAGGEAADLNEDGIVDDTDLAQVGEDYGAFAWLYEYDVYGNLIYAGSPCAGEYETAYDAFGRRVWERIDPAGGSPVETHFVYDGDALVLELSPSGQPLVQYVWGLLGPIARVDLQNGSNTRYYVLDARGHARAMVDSTGSATDYYEHDAWGNVLPGSFGSTPNPFKWNAAAGYQHIPFTGLYCVGAREYDPRTGRWLQRDPIGQSSGDPNVYRYCGNDAVNGVDPDGLRDASYEECLTLINKINTNIGIIAEEWTKFDADRDIIGGDKHKYGVTSPGGHLGEMSDALNGIRKKLRAFQKGNCKRFSKLRLPHSAISEATSRVSTAKNLSEAARARASRLAANRLSQNVVEKGAKQSCQNTLETGTKKVAKKVLGKVPGANVAVFAYDWAQGGFAHAVNEATWPVSLLWSR